MLGRGPEIAELAGLEDRLAAVDRVQFLAGAVDVIAHGGVAARQDQADLLVGLADRRPAQALDLAFRQLAVRRHALLGAHGADIARDKAARDDAQQVAMLGEVGGQVDRERSCGEKLTAAIWPKGRCTGTTMAAVQSERFSKSARLISSR